MTRTPQSRVCPVPGQRYENSWSGRVVRVMQVNETTGRVQVTDTATGLREWIGAHDFGAWKLKPGGVSVHP